MLALFLPLALFLRNLKQALQPAPESPYLPAAFAIKRIIICAYAFFLSTAACFYLTGRPFWRPSNFATLNPIM
jgi:hypothetical protein